MTEDDVNALEKNAVQRRGGRVRVRNKINGVIKAGLIGM